MKRIKGKIALVTGGASGIGTACVERFLAEGARVVSTDLTQQDRPTTPDFLPLAQDVADEVSWEDVIAQTIQSFGRLDILVNMGPSIVSSRSLRLPAIVGRRRASFC